MLTSQYIIGLVVALVIIICGSIAGFYNIDNVRSYKRYAKLQITKLDYWRYCIFKAKNICLQVDDDKHSINVKFNNNHFYEVFLSKDEMLASDDTKLIKKKFRWVLQTSDTERVINELYVREHSDKVQITHCVVSIAVESPAYLKKAYNFTHPTGYLIIENDSCGLGEKEITTNLIRQPSPTFSPNEIDKVRSLVMDYNSDFIQEGNKSRIEKAEFITRLIWSFYSTTGPSNLINANHTPSEILQLIKENGGTVQCTGTRDLFVNIASIIFPELEITKIDAFRYYPHIPNIVNNGHSLLEIRTPNGSYIFDPFVRVYFKDQSDNKLSVEKLGKFLKKRNYDNIIPVHVYTSHKKRLDFELKNDPFSPQKYNYFSHFNEIRSVELYKRPQRN